MATNSTQNSNSGSSNKPSDQRGPDSNAPVREPLNQKMNKPKQDPVNSDETLKRNVDGNS